LAETGCGAAVWVAMETQRVVSKPASRLDCEVGHTSVDTALCSA